MPEPRRLRVALLCEDGAHEFVGRALLERCASEEELAIGVETLSASLGIPRVRAELKALQRLRLGGGIAAPDLLVVLIDANRIGVLSRRHEVEGLLDTSLFPEVVIGVPDPYVERWLLADPSAFFARFGVEPPAVPGTDRTTWKRALVEALESADEIVTQGGAEFAYEIVEDMNLYAAGRAVPSLGACVDELRAALRRLKLAVPGEGGQR